MGIDVLADEAVDEELFEMVLTPSEHATVSTRPKIQRRLLATLAFASKEATFKAQFPLCGRWLEFQDVEVDLPLQLDSQRMTIRARVLPPRDEAVVAPLAVSICVIRHDRRWWAATWLT
jgi:4'-phosphopantetheinyl transferase EntD